MKKALILLAVAAAGLAAAAANAMGVDLSSLISPETAIGLSAIGALGTTKYVQAGHVMDYVNGGAAIVSGKMLVIGTKVGIALGAIAAGATGSVRMSGVFNYAKLATDVVAQGALLYYDSVNDRLTTTAAGNTLAGHAMNAAGNGVATVNVCMNGVPGG